MKLSRLAIGLAVLAFAGLMDASYLTYEHYANGSASCFVGGCEQVLTSDYSEVAGLPVSLLGGGYYLAVFFAAVALIDAGKKTFLKVIAGVSGTGLVVSGYLVYLQLGVIGSICVYCMFSAAVTATTCVLSWLGLKRFQ